MKAKKILIAEDDAFCRDAMERLLQSSGYETRSCSCGREALACLEEEAFDMLITDLQMPGMDGLQLIGKARNMAPMLRTILVTGVPPGDLGYRLRRARVNGFVSKPVDWQRLFLLLENLARRGEKGLENLAREDLVKSPKDEFP
jgi:DNA-binding NtrC family response regulator